MENIQLPQEEFAAKALLSEISQQVAKGRAELAQLQQAKTSFFHERELELMQRLQLLLDNSYELLKIVDYNHNILAAYSQELTAFAIELTSWREKMTAEQSEFITIKEGFLAQFDAKQVEFEKIMGDIKMQNEAIERTRLEQDKRTLDLNSRETAINDKYMQLLQTTKRLKK